MTNDFQRASITNLEYKLVEMAEHIEGREASAWEIKDLFLKNDFIEIENKEYDLIFINTHTYAHAGREIIVTIDLFHSEMNVYKRDKKHRI